LLYIASALGGTLTFIGTATSTPAMRLICSALVSWAVPIPGGGHSRVRPSNESEGTVLDSTNPPPYPVDCSPSKTWALQDCEPRSLADLAP
jgi:hypothetical protein